MPYDFYTFTAAGFCVLYLALAIAAILLCVLIYHYSRSIGWLFLGVLFVEPLYRVAFRAVRGLPLLWYRTTSSVGPDGISTQTIRFDIPVLYIFAVVGLFLLYRRARRERPSA
jgi:hypothetical protein